MVTEQEASKFDRPWIKSFRDKVRSLGYSHQDDDPPTLRTDTETSMYHLLFFSKHEAGLKLWRGIKQIGFDQQRRLPYDV